MRFSEHIYTEWRTILLYHLSFFYFLSNAHSPGYLSQQIFFHVSMNDINKIMCFILYINLNWKLGGAPWNRHMSNCLISIHMSAHRTENIQRQSSTMIYKPLAVAIQQDRCDIRWLLSLMLLRSDHQRCKKCDLWFVKDAHSSRTIWKKNRTQICGNKSKKRLFFFFVAFSQIGDKIR